jgi:hypothetical protein
MMPVAFHYGWNVKDATWFFSVTFGRDPRTGEPEPAVCVRSAVTSALNIDSRSHLSHRVLGKWCMERGLNAGEEKRGPQRPAIA